MVPSSIDNASTWAHTHTRLRDAWWWFCFPFLFFFFSNIPNSNAWQQSQWPFQLFVNSLRWNEIFWIEWHIPITHFPWTSRYSVVCIIVDTLFGRCNGKVAFILITEMLTIEDQRNKRTTNAHYGGNDCENLLSFAPCFRRIYICGPCIEDLHSCDSWKLAI